MSGGLEDHTLAPGAPLEGVRYDLKPCRTADGALVPDLFSAWITLDNPAKLNAYTTPMLKSLVHAFDRPYENVVATARVPHEVRVPSPGRFEHDAEAAWRRGPREAYAVVSTDLDVLGVSVYDQRIGEFFFRHSSGMPRRD